MVIGRPRLLTDPQKFELRLMREAGVTIKVCESWFDVERTTLYRALRELRKKLGPEKLKRRQSARSDIARWQNRSPSEQSPVE